MVVRMTRPGARPAEPAPPGRGRTGWRTGLIVLLLATGLAVTAVSSSGQAAWALDRPDDATVSPADPTSPETPAPRHPRWKTLLKREWGVEVMYVRQTAAGYMLEFRYRVLDAEKAKPLFERRTKPVLIHEETGARLIVPTPAKTGALRNSNLPVEGRIYWMFFANPGKLVDQGNRVSIEIGEFRADGLVVQ